ncbi:MAG: hypothetical protein KGS72_11745 [Cyanobacteria bacterium REEB67]|nr:hypothetical protein [Cyanobacteria bacterium REEB67]
MSHFVKVALYFFASALVTLGFGIGAGFASGALFGGILVSALVSAAAVAGGVFLTVQARSLFNLMQTGRFIQYGSFWLSGLVALKVAALLFSSVLVVTNGALASLVATAICFTAATASGRIPWKGRTWLPVRMKSRK